MSIDIKEIAVKVGNAIMTDRDISDGWVGNWNPDIDLEITIDGQVRLDKIVNLVIEELRK